MLIPILKALLVEVMVVVVVMVVMVVVMEVVEVMAAALLEVARDWVVLVQGWMKANEVVGAEEAMLRSRLLVALVRVR